MSPTSPAAATEDSPRRRPLRADAERNRQRILAAAREVFAERGLDVTLDDIARHAGVGVGTAYRRFANREELIDAVFDDGARELVEIAEQALAREDPWDGLTDLFTAAGQHLADNRGLRQILLERGQGASRSDGLRERLTPAVSAVMERAQRSGQLRDDMEVTDFPLIQLMLGTVTLHSHAVDPQLWRRYLTVVLDGLRHDRDRPTPLPRPALGEREFDRAMR
ncbi:helix-turn-helix domain-containing protein [Streptomyces sp. NPDC001941]|uniref:TetR/AcrR family transcriptional regulator n=1 Tax=Streptomyces sp. NPDC001941 TaxID=3154659 RepID=UPI003321CBC0